MYLIDAVKLNNETEVLRLLKPGTQDPDGKPINIHEVDPKWQGTAVYWAAAYGYLSLIEPLVRAGISVDKPNKIGATPIYIAAQEGYVDIIKALADLNANPSTAMCDGATPVHVAALHGHVDVIQTLVAVQASPSPRMHDGRTPLYIAAQAKHSGVVQALVNLKASLNFDTEWIALVKIAASQNDNATVRVLLKLGTASGSVVASPERYKVTNIIPLSSSILEALREEFRLKSSSNTEKILRYLEGMPAVFDNPKELVPIQTRPLTPMFANRLKVEDGFKVRQSGIGSPGKERDVLSCEKKARSNSC